eukprot:Hpha_TRINITY_DN36157_c0_g1::TRINITY_DN36157_c0_g1_i1::g.36224::m.36224
MKEAPLVVRQRGDAKWKASLRRPAPRTRRTRPLSPPVAEPSPVEVPDELLLLSPLPPAHRQRRSPSPPSSPAPSPIPLSAVPRCLSPYVSPRCDQGTVLMPCLPSPRCDQSPAPAPESAEEAPRSGYPPGRMEVPPEVLHFLRQKRREMTKESAARERELQNRLADTETALTAEQVRSGRLQGALDEALAREQELHAKMSGWQRDIDVFCAERTRAAAEESLVRQRVEELQAELELAYERLRAVDAWTAFDSARRNLSAARTAAVGTDG